MQHTLTIPDWHPARINELLKNHWQAARLKKRDREMVWAYSHDVPKAQGKRSVELIIQRSGSGRPPDPDAFTKSLNDALVQCKLLRDDSANWVVNLPVTIKLRNWRKQTTIILTDI